MNDPKDLEWYDIVKKMMNIIDIQAQEIKELKKKLAEAHDKLFGYAGYNPYQE